MKLKCRIQMKLKCPECDSNGPFKAMVSFMIETSEDSRVGSLDLNTPFWEFDAYRECLLESRINSGFAFHGSPAGVPAGELCCSARLTSGSPNRSCISRICSSDFIRSSRLRNATVYPHSSLYDNTNKRRSQYAIQNSQDVFPWRIESHQARVVAGRNAARLLYRWENRMNLHNITAIKDCGKKIASVMFAGDHFDLVTRIVEMKEQHAQALVEGFTYIHGGGWSKMTAPVPTLELKFEDIELWNCGRNWVVKDGHKEFLRNSEHQARRVLCEMLEGV